MRYNELLEECKQVTAKGKAFCRRYPRWSRYLTPEAVIFKTRTDYRITKYYYEKSKRIGKRIRNRSYISYFSDLYGDITRGKEEPYDEETQKEIDYLIEAKFKSMIYQYLS